MKYEVERGIDVAPRLISLTSIDYVTVGTARPLDGAGLAHIAGHFRATTSCSPLPEDARGFPRAPRPVS